VGPKRLRIGSDVEIARRFADDLRARHGEVVFSEGDFWFYDKTHWCRIEERHLRRTVHSYDGVEYPTTRSTAIVRLNKGHVDSILHELGAILARLDFFADAPTSINCDSGFIRFADDGRPSLEAHDREHRRRHVLKGSWIPHRIFYDPAFNDSLLRRLIEEVFRGDPDNAEKMALVQEIAGAAALG
jgi:D5 N terminal like